MTNRYPDGLRVAVVGGLGFIGSHICRTLVSHGFKVKAVGRHPESHALVADIIREIDIVKADMMQPGEMIDAVADADIIIDLAHTTRPGSSMRDPIHDVSSNIAGHVEWLQHLSATKVRRIIYVSSGGVIYGTPRYNPIDEGHPTDPLCAYGISKLSIEKYVAMYSRLSTVAWTLLRPANVYGIGNRVNVGQGVIGVLADRALKGLPLEVWGDGESLRDYLYVDDMASAVLSLMAYEGPHHVFNVSSGRGSSVLDVIENLRAVLGELPPVVHIPSRGFDVSANVLSSDRLTRETGWTPEVDLPSGISQLVNWMRLSAD